MMKFEIVSYTPKIDSTSVVMGHLQVNVNQKFTCWLVVFKGKEGSFYFSVPSVKIEEKYVPAFEFKDTQFAKEALTELKAEFKARFLRA